MGHAWIITAKDLRTRLRDRSALLWGFIVPFGLAALFSSLFDFGGDTAGVHFAYAVVDQDGGELAVAFTDQVLAGVADDGFADITAMDDLGAARQATADGDLDATFVIPAGFTASVSSNAPAQLEVIGNVDATIATQVAGSIAASFAQELTAVQTSVALVAASGGGVGGAELEEIAHAAGNLPSPVTFGQVEASPKQLDATTYLMAGMAVFFLFFTVQFGVTGILEERQNGTLARLGAAPIRHASIYAGKLLTSVVLGLISMTTLIVTSAFLLGAQWGDPLGVAVLVLAGVLSAVAIAAFVATLARTAEQANVWQSIIAVVLGMLGGAFFPIAQGTGFLSQLTLITPHQWFLRGLGELAADGGVVDVLPAAGAILVFAAVGFAVASTRMRGELMR